MFSSLTSFLFGSNTSAIANSETTAETILSGETNQRDSINSVDADNLIEVTSLTPSVTGATCRGQQQQQQQRTALKRGGKNKRNNTRQQNKRKGITKSNTAKATPSLTKLLTPSDSCDEDFDEEDWYIVEKEDDDEEDDNSTPRTDSEGENTLVNEIVKAKPAAVVTTSLAQQRRQQHINLHSLYSGPRPQKQRNYLQKSRSNNSTRGSGLSVSTLSPSRTVNGGRNASEQGVPADGGLTRSLYVASSPTGQPQQQQQPEIISPAAIVGIANGSNNNKMDESWFVTPPPCFTSIGPINMETSPYENLLIEHPSMSVYHSIKSAQEATESFIKLDIGVNEQQTEKRPAKDALVQRKNSQSVQQRSSGYRLDKQSVAQLKQELLARTMQKTQTKRERNDICRSAIKRANKVREVQSKNHTQRRSDRQYSKIVSNANNNRKSATCF